MKTKKNLFIALMLLISMAAQSQDKVYMPFFNIENMHSAYQISAAKIFRSYVNANNKYLLLLPETTDTIYTVESFDQTQKNAKTAGAKYFLIAEMNALNDVMIVSMSLYKTSDTSRVWGDMLKARTLEDLDPILQRFAKNLGTDKKASVDGDIYTVTDYDAKELNKISTTPHCGLAICGGYFLVNKVKNSTPAGFGLLATYDVRDVIFDLEGDFLFGDIKSYGVRISGLYPFKSSKNTPFVGGSIAWSGISATYKNSYYDYSNYYSNNRSGGGLALYANGGYIFNRNASVNFRVTGSFVLPTYKVGDKYPVGGQLGGAIIF